MNVKHIDTFLAIASTGSFTAAARKLHSTQPAVSMRIRELESQLGVDLFDRDRKKVRLTVHGREFLEYARRISALSKEARFRIGARALLTGRLRLGVTETIALTWLPDLVARVNEDYPNVVLELDMDLSRHVLAKLEAGEVDLALLPGPISLPNMQSRSLGSVLYTWMASPNLGIPYDRLSPKDLQHWPLITLPTASNLHYIVDDWYRGDGVTPRRVDVCNNLSVVAKLVKAGLGIAMLPPSIFRAEIDRGEMIVLDVHPAMQPMPFVSLYRKSQVSDLALAISDLAVEHSFLNAPDPA
jgi:DNA-binding transcriptional LysR family regulator